MLSKKESVLSAVGLIYFVCYSFRFMEYFIMRTDETFWGEAFVHKLAGIVILCAGVKYFHFRFTETGFTNRESISYLWKGLASGLAVYVPAYLAEIAIVAAKGRFETLDLYVSAYSVDGSDGKQTGFLFFLICIAGNIINVIMEEGIFRGLFQKILEKKYSFMVSAVISSGFFGIWHVMAPLRSFYDKTMSFESFLANAILLSVTSALTGFGFALMTKLTGSLYMAMAYHFFNNTIVNMLHVVSHTGVDEFMVVRVSVAEILLFVAIWIWYMSVRHKEHEMILDRTTI